MSTVPKGLQ